MPAFTCTFNTNNLPAEVRRGSKISAVVTAIGYNAPIQNVTISADAYGISQRLKKQSEDTFLLELGVPFFVPPGSYQYSIWAVSVNGDKSEKQIFRVVIK